MAGSDHVGTLQQPPNPAAVLDHFEADGSLRDLYVFETSPARWSELISALFSSDMEVELTVDDSPTTDTARVEAALSELESHGRLLVRTAGAQINAHLFAPDEIEFDLDLQEWSANNLDGLLSFMGVLLHATERNVYLTLENCPEHCILALLEEGSEFVVPCRPAASTEFGQGVGAAVTLITEHFRRGTGPTLPEPTRSNEAVAALARWSRLHHPNDYDWHSQLTVEEFRALRQLDTAFGIFFGPHSATALCDAGGFEMAALKRQFWEAVEAARRVF